MSRRGAGAPLLLLVAASFARVDQKPSIRQLYPIAELGKPAGEKTRAPEFMRLMVAPEPAADSRDEDRFPRRSHGADLRPGDPVPKRSLTFVIEVTDEGQTSGPAGERAPDVPELARNRHA